MNARRLWSAIGASAIWFFGTGAFSVSVADPPDQSMIAASTAVADGGNTCAKCHAAAVAGFARSKMAQSMRVGGQEPSGVVRIPGTTIRMYSDKNDSWQSLESDSVTTTYHVDYVIGSGTHAHGYLINLDHHLFQSPVAYYRSRTAYGMAPGYEKSASPDFTRPVGEGCVFCHAGSFNAIAGTQNEYGEIPFPHLSIGCNRCHGDTAAHLADPDAGNIVNPEYLGTAARDSVCEQCHLIGAARVLNPGKRFSDFQAGEPLEDIFTIYRIEAPEGAEARFRVISHSEQLALSQCKIRSAEKMWCGTCHDPHNEPTDPVAYYRAKCLQCHAGTAFPAVHPAKTSNCIGCHMPRRDAQDGGHTAFTDHRIQRTPETGLASEATSIVPWREPPSNLAKRNLGIALIRVGMERKSFKQVAKGYEMLTEVQQEFSQDSEMFNALGTALDLARQYGEAVQAFQLAVRFDPLSSPKEASLGQDYEALGDQQQAERHLEKAMELDSLNLSAAELLISIYERNGELSKADELSKKLIRLTRGSMEHK